MSAKGTQITVLYPNKTDATFDMEYYLKSHMPMVQEKFGAHGMKGYTVLKFLGTPDPNTPSPYSVQATLFFDTPQQFEAGVKAEAPTVMGDIPNFTNTEPVLMVGDVVGGS